MDDILSQGGDRDPSPWPRRLAVIAALVAVVAGGAAYLGLHRSRVTASPVPAPTAAPGLQAGPAGPGGIAGPTLAWDSGLRLPVAGAQPVWFSPASGRSALIGGLPADSAGYQFTRVADGWAVQASRAGITGCGGCAGPPTPVWFLADGGPAATRVGTANLVAPGATAGAVWLTSYAAGAPVTTTAGTAREAGATGSLALPVRLPPGYAIERGTDRGLLLVPSGQQPGAVVSKLWDPAASRFGPAFDRVLAAGPDEIAWLPRCPAKCAVQVLNLASGRRTAVALPAGNAVASGAFSPDGRFLALQVGFGNGGDGGDQATQMLVAPVATGRLAAVPGTWASSDAFVGFGWPAGGDSLVAEYSFTATMQLASWRPGASHPAVKVIRPGANQAALILG
ncbi:MAG TPA: hypothetical protein VGD91_13630 [Trebonia sp.]